MSAATKGAWRRAPFLAFAGSVAIGVEAASNAMRAYTMGGHVTVPVTTSLYSGSVAADGAALAAGGCAVAVFQAKSAVQTFAEGVPGQQRALSALMLMLCVSMSASAMASHVLQMQRHHATVEADRRSAYDRAEAEYRSLRSEYEGLGNPRPVATIQADVQSVRIDPDMWRRSAQCSDITRPDTKVACEPVLALYKERGNAARKAELEPRLQEAKAKLDHQERPAEMTAAEAMLATIWPWLAALVICFVGTFGFAIIGPSRRPVDKSAQTPDGRINGPIAGLEFLRERIVAQEGEMVTSNAELAALLGTSAATASRWRSQWVRDGHIIESERDGRYVLAIAKRRLLSLTSS